MKNRENGGKRNHEDSRLNILERMLEDRPQSLKYEMVVPKSVEEADGMCRSASRTHLKNMLAQKAIMFSVRENGAEQPIATFVCRLGGDEQSYSYLMKGDEGDGSQELRTYERECVEYSMKNILRSQRLAKAEFMDSLAAYNPLGCGAVAP